jgi:hypothetical protein
VSGRSEDLRRVQQWPSVWISIAVILAIFIAAAAILGDWLIWNQAFRPQTSVIPQPRIPPDEPAPATPSTLP